jgi:hypothetical protein
MEVIVLLFYFVFLRLVYRMFPVSLDCSFSIAPSVFSNIYLPIDEASPLIDEDFFLLRLEAISKIFFMVFVILFNMSVSMCHVYIISSGRHGHDRI